MKQRETRTGKTAVCTGFFFFLGGGRYCLLRNDEWAFPPVIECWLPFVTAVSLFAARYQLGRYDRAGGLTDSGGK